MLLSVLQDNSPFVTIALILAGSGGAIGVVIALIKLPSDRSNAAVSQAQGSMEIMSELNENLVAALERANTRADLYKLRAEILQAKLDRLEPIYGPWPPDPPGRSLTT